ncbi:hypothetical protein LWI29_014641 [Acer saccharum]|uniref:Protein kinase domain-containing protein n=1 Tax=Acer saccharum TaxID=4024 RepID=A0AA39T235_ACESA|nr:hypothetical protein LWI29_014641 [Acer saccharum]
MIPFWRKKHQEKEAFVLKNGGILLEQLITTFDGKRNPIHNFSSEELKLATNNYNTMNFIMDGDCFKLYKGFLPDRQISVMKFDYSYKCEYDECINNIVFASQMCHKHILKLIGCCLETEVPILVFESLVKYGTLGDYILNHHKCHLETLSWRQRLKIAMEISHTFAYLHIGFPRPIVYSLMDSSQFLLDEHCVPKLFDFSHAQCIPEGETQIKDAQLRGTFGYIAPEHMEGVLDEKSDVYGFGILLLELLTGHRIFDLMQSISETEDETETKDEDRKFFARVGDYWLRDFETGDENWSCRKFVKNINGENWFIVVVDPTIIGAGLCPETRQQIQVFLELVVIKCLSLSGGDRPSMIDVAKQLKQLYLSASS